MRLKPKVLVDVKCKINAFSGLKPILNLSFRPVLRSVPDILKKTAVFGVLLGVLMFNLASAPTAEFTAAAVSSVEERAALQAELDALESQIAEYEKTISAYQAQGKTLTSEINKLVAKVDQLNLQIKSVNLQIRKLDDDIVVTANKISETSEEIKNTQGVIAVALQKIAMSEDHSVLEILLQNPQLSDFFTNINNLMDMEDSLRLAVRQLNALKQDYVDQNEQLKIAKSDAAELKQYQESQKSSLESLKTEKDTLLKETKGKESVYQQILTEKKKTAAEIRSRIFEILGGGELTFEKAYELASAAEKATGVRAALILAVLDRESALGRNTGRCNYKTAMHPTRDIPAFLQITSELNLDPNSTLVSCPIVADGAYGGAIGPAQFLPSTWMLYKTRLAALVGVAVPNPWNNSHAFFATALYLKDAGASSNERMAAAKYYCGSNWSRYVCTNVYAAAVLKKATEFQDDIDVLNS
ncbi:MAG TPA: lytic murein transglycosylase [Candidatus Colwellbacteria bacterium]|nr:lytic murein transglycosylase [Candidatus Colwellbacteria bacterium]HQA96089.1 lytic murein transglycosylase [Candidatus Colwellbacteria bacterium]